MTHFYKVKKNFYIELMKKVRTILWRAKLILKLRRLVIYIYYTFQEILKRLNPNRQLKLKRVISENKTF